MSAERAAEEPGSARRRAEAQPEQSTTPGGPHPPGTTTSSCGNGGSSEPSEGGARVTGGASRRARICIDLTPLEIRERYGGIGRYALHLLEELVALPAPERAGVEILGVISSAGGPVPGEAALEQARHLGELLPARRHHAQRRLALSRRLRQARVDLFHATEAAALPLRPGCPVVSTCYDVIPLVAPKRRGGPVAFWQRERLRLAQWVPVTLAAIGVTYLTFVYGRPPWIALLLAFSFGFYGLVKKLAPLGSLYGLTLETGILFLPALIYLLVMEFDGIGAFIHDGARTTSLLIWWAESPDGWKPSVRIRPLDGSRRRPGHCDD